MTTAAMTTPRVSGAQALAVAEANALRTHRDLSPYRIEVVLEMDGWHVAYQLTGPRRKGVRPTTTTSRL